MFEDCDVLALHSGLKRLGMIDFRKSAEDGRRELRAAIPNAFKADVPGI
jgi:hypothetical protein